MKPSITSKKEHLKVRHLSEADIKLFLAIAFLIFIAAFANGV